jgi:superfamily II DNA or RNA helicase
MAEGTSPNREYGGLSEREFILQRFAEGKYQVLVAMKCLDEGVDVPPARTVILLASSGNPREYIQRIGRVTRRFADKDEATIYDIVVVPTLDNIPTELKNMELKILASELARYEEIAKVAVNGAEALATIYGIKNRLMEAKK